MGVRGVRVSPREMHMHWGEHAGLFCAHASTEPKHACLACLQEQLGIFIHGEAQLQGACSNAIPCTVYKPRWPKAVCPMTLQQVLVTCKLILAIDNGQLYSCKVPHTLSNLIPCIACALSNTSLHLDFALGDKVPTCIGHTCLLFRLFSNLA